MNKKTIKIAGAGIAGLSSAIILSKNGYRVSVFEKNDDVGKRYNGDFQGLVNWGFEEDALDFMKMIGLNIDFWNKPVNKIMLFGPKNSCGEAESKTPPFYLVRRGNMENSLDVSLKRQALQDGVEIIFNYRANEEEVDIVATGLIHKEKPDGMALGYTFESNLEDISVAIFGNEFSSNGYAYCFVVNGCGTVGVCSFDNFSEISNHLQKTIIFLKKKFNLDIKNEKKFAGIENFRSLKDNKKFIGEAGGFLDFLFGYGMRYALITGELAAKSIIYKQNFGDLCEKELSGLIKTSISNRFFYTFLGKSSRPYKYFIKRISDTDDVRGLLTKIYRPSFISKIIYPLAKIYFAKNIK